MKKLLYILLLVFMTIPLGGCFENTNTKGTKILLNNKAPVL